MAILELIEDVETIMNNIQYKITNNMQLTI